MVDMLEPLMDMGIINTFQHQHWHVYSMLPPSLSVWPVSNHKQNPFQQVSHDWCKKAVVCIILNMGWCIEKYLHRKVLTMSLSKTFLLSSSTKMPSQEFVYMYKTEPKESLTKLSLFLNDTELKFFFVNCQKHLPGNILKCPLNSGVTDMLPQFQFHD